MLMVEVVQVVLATVRNLPQQPATPLRIDGATIVQLAFSDDACALNMSVPRSNYDPRRVCLNPFPSLDISLGKYRRTAGVYIAGGLVRLHPIVVTIFAK